MRRRWRFWPIVAILTLLGGVRALRPRTAHPSPSVALAETTALQSSAPGSSSFHTTTISIPTYPYASHLRSVYTPAYNMSYSSLDWSSYNSSGPAPVLRDYELLVLENDYLYVTLLPELGGRVYQMIFKPTGHNEFYQNPVVKPTHWGPTDQGWWLAAGGIEWCLPVAEHGYEWGEPWDYQVTTSAVGVTVELRDTTAADRLRAVITVHLPKDRAYLAITPRIENPTGNAIDYQYWTNAMLAPGAANAVGENLHLFFSAEEMSVHSTGDNRLPGHGVVPTGPDYRFSWPVYGGIDFSRLGNWDEWLGFFEYPQAAAGFVGVYDIAANEGIVRVFPSSVARGTKGFGHGWANKIDSIHWTDDGSTYFELHGGVAPNFWDRATIIAGQSLEWTEYWYPVSGVERLRAATAGAALSVRESAGRFHIGVHSTAFHAANASQLYIWNRDDCTELGRWGLPAIGPGTPFAVSVASGGWGLADTAFVYLDEEGNLLVALNPCDCLPPKTSMVRLPLWVETPAFGVAWTGRDVWTGITAYDVQFRDDYEGTWTDWLTNTTETYGIFSGAHGHTYFFRARARDSHGNLESYGDEEWGQAFTTVLTGTAPVLVTSRKSTALRTFSHDQAVAYTTVISNTGNLTASVTLTDTPPPTMKVVTETLAAVPGLTWVYPGGILRWSGTVAPGGDVRLTYALSPTAATPYGVPLTNTVEISGSVLGPFTRQETVVQAHILWLPLVMRGW